MIVVGLWTEGERVVRARFRATSCASLIAYAEVACAALEAGMRAARSTRRGCARRSPASTPATTPAPISSPRRSAPPRPITEEPE